MQTEAVVDVRRTSKSFGRLRVLDNVSLTIGRGEMVALIGASGSGKSTLIRALAALTPIDRGPKGDNPENAGRIAVMGHPIQDRGRIDCNRDLRVRIGVIFQQFNLVPRLSLLTNVCLGLLGRLPVVRGTFGRFTAAEKLSAMQALARVGIEQHALKRASELSGGQQQRAAIARTLVQGAELLIADEPIASLDPASARRVMDLLADMNRRDGITIFISLHQVEYAVKYCPRVIALRAGKIVYDGPSSALTPTFLGQIYGAESEELFLPSLEERLEPAPRATGEVIPMPVRVQPSAAHAGIPPPTTAISESARLNA